MAGEGIAVRKGYPTNRKSHYAHRITRVLFKSCAALDIGHHAVHLIIHVAHTEDAARYRGPVRFWNSQLLSTLGLSSPKQLNAARQKAIDAGWLVYARSHDRAVGQYWTQIPGHLLSMDDTPIEDYEDADLCTLRGTESGTRNGTGSGKDAGQTPRIHSPGGTQSGTGTGMQSGTGTGTGKGAPSNPNPNPIPNTPSACADDEKGSSEQKTTKRISGKEKPRTYSDAFNKFWGVYWNKAGKAKASEAFRPAIARIASDPDIPQATDTDSALRWLIHRTTLYKSQLTEATEKLHASTYLNQDRFNDELVDHRRHTQAGYDQVKRRRLQ